MTLRRLTRSTRSEFARRVWYPLYLHVLYRGLPGVRPHRSGWLWDRSRWAPRPPEAPLRFYLTVNGNWLIVSDEENYVFDDEGNRLGYIQGNLGRIHAEPVEDVPTNVLIAFTHEISALARASAAAAVGATLLRD